MLKIKETHINSVVIKIETYNIKIPSGLSTNLFFRLRKKGIENPK